ncbi:MAG: porin [Campylobacterales bacterium]|nr:porin [Campylobacterales bacterium]
MKKVIVLSMVASGLVLASGYKIPEQSVSSMALAAAYTANVNGADASYYNPAAMSFMEDKNFISGGLSYIHLPSAKFSSNAGTTYSGKSETEDILVPNLHFVSRAYGDFRWGVSLTAPGGLSKRWESAYQKASAQEFTLKILDLNPTLAYKISDNFSVGVGARMIYTQGVVKSDASDTGTPLSRDMEGDDISFGYNIALHYKPTDDINLAATYRSNVTLKPEGDATLGFMGSYNTYGASVEIPLPAALVLAASKTWGDLTVELNYERTYWSKYKDLDFNYDQDIGGLAPYFDDPKPKNWKDTDAFRIGVTYKVNDKLTTMAGFAIDETPAPLETLGFELPDSDSKIYSLGVKYKMSDALTVGVAFLYLDKDTRTLDAGVNSNGVLVYGGEFSGSGAYITTLGVEYEF